MGYEIHFACISHIGKIRNLNQDSYICNGSFPPVAKQQSVQTGSVLLKQPLLLGVFDGMGGEECGEMAAYIAAKEAAKTPFASDGVAALKAYCKRTNEKICAYAEENDVFSMGTTAAILLFEKNEITLCNVGDSKIFRIKDGTAEQISIDHLGIGAYGKKPPLLQYLGMWPEEGEPQPYFARGGYEAGDRYLICSDGLSDMVSPEEMSPFLMQPPEEAAEGLVKLALEGGGKDNVTVMILEIKHIKNKGFGFLKTKQKEKKYEVQ